MRIPKSASDHAVHDDRYYGHRVISEAIERMIMALFSCTQDSMSATIEAQQQQKPPADHAPRLSYFVAYALYRTRLPMMVVYFAMLLLKRLKTQYPVARGSSGHRLFISSFMLASKMLCDDAYNNKSWVIVSQNLFSLHEVNQMERELFMYLDLDLHASAEDISSFAIEMEMYGAPSVTLDDLKRTRLSSHSSAASTPSSTPSRTPATRRKSHRRCLSLRPDYWAHPGTNAPMSATVASSRHYRSESNEWRASGIQRLTRTLARSSMPAQRYAPIVPSTTHAPYYASSGSAAAAVAASKHHHDASMSPSMSWSSFYSTTNASSMSITTPNSLGSSLRPTPSTSLSELSLNSPLAGMYNAVPPPPPPPPMRLHTYHGWEQPVAKVPAYEVNESFRMRPMAVSSPRDAM